MSKSKQDLLLVIVGTCLGFYFSGKFDLLEQVVEWSYQYEEFEIDELFTTSIILVALLFFYSIRRQLESKEKAILLTSALEEVKTLKGILPICAYCHKIRNDEGAWNQLEHYIRENSDAEFSHGICPDCLENELAK